MDFVLSKEHEMLRKMYREFAETEVKPLASEVDETEEFPMETVKKMAKLGMMGIYFPKEYGGAGADTLAYAMCVEELAKDACHAVGNHFVANHLADVHLVVVIPVKGADMAQVVAANIGVLLVGFALHALPYAIGDGLCSETLINAPVGSNGFGADDFSGLPLCEWRYVGWRAIVVVATGIRTKQEC